MRRKIEFGVYQLDPETNELWKRGKRLSLPLKPAKVLVLLASSPGQLVTRETLRDLLWGVDTFVDFEHGLNFCIRKIRLALKDDARKPRFIETLPKRGYRFIAATSHDTPSGTAAPEPRPTSESAEVQANAHYSKARAALAAQGKSSLDEAYREFQSALALKPDYAMAHSGMGATIALRMLNRRDHDELQMALHHLQRAVELDGELSEPYPWLCFVHIRRGDTGLALQAGLRAVALQPDLAQAHYFLGLAYLVTSEEGADHYQDTVDRLLDAARVGPHWHATWFVLAYTAMLLGDYSRAIEFSHRLIQTYRQPGMPFVGAEIVLASVQLRQGDSEGARQVIVEFLECLAASDHMYRDAMTAVAACVLGDVELRAGHYDAALVAYRRAWQTAQEHTRIVAHLRISARAQTGLATAYWTLGQHGRSVSLLEKAKEMAIESVPVSLAAAAATITELYLSLAAGFALSEQKDCAIEMIVRAVKAGWRDAEWLERDPLLASLREEATFRNSLAKIRSFPAVRWAVLLPH
jgi:DNA-binding winged helix-turn-helix (wHTH) protein/cytochrome c-type biogenesis protein CcmH/NrfG